jgi:C1A family cysteine protease
MEYICNLKQSLPDNRDYIFANNNLKVPKILDYRLDLQPIRDQGKQGTCYAQATACMKEWQEKQDNGFNEYFSPQFFYNNRPNKYDDNNNNDDGMYGRDVMKLIKNIGICREKSYPYGRIQTKSDISEQIYQEAKEYIIKSYYRINTIKDLKESLCRNGPCLIAFPVYNYGSQFWKKNSEKTYGGHAVVLVGYNEDGFIVRNSWGHNWGNQGYSIYEYNDWGSHWEIWTTIDLDNDIKYIPSKNKCCILM